MLTSFQKAVLGTLAGAAVLIALVISAKGSTPVSLVSGGTSTLATPVNTGGIAPGIVTTGDGTAKVKPDVAIITVGAVAQAATASDAQQQVSQRVDAILKRARDLGIADRDIKNAGYNINPQYASGPGQAPKITGYQATQQISLTYRKVDDAGKALDALVQGDAAANTLSIRLTLDDPKKAQADARAQAVQDARSKAEAMAKTAGVTLGKVIAVSDLSSPSYPMYDAFKGGVAMPAPAAAQIPTGDLDVVVRVQVQFEIQ